MSLHAIFLFFDSLKEVSDIFTQWFLKNCESRKSDLFPEDFTRSLLFNATFAFYKPMDARVNNVNQEWLIISAWFLKKCTLCKTNINFP